MEVTVISAPELVFKEGPDAARRCAHISQFCELLARDYLQKRGLEQTLETLDREVAERGEPAPSLQSWQSTAHLLALPELLNENSASGSPFETIVEVLVAELVRETNVRMRRPVTLTTTRGAPACAFACTANQQLLTRCVSEGGGHPAALQRARETARKPPIPAPSQMTHRNEPPLTSHRSLGKISLSAPTLRLAPKLVAQAQQRKELSRENWIPVDCRERILRRNLAVTKMNIESLNIRKGQAASEAAHHQLSEIELNLNAESLFLKKKKLCGLCGMQYSEINLVLAVPFKAVQDLRSTWAEQFEPHPKHVAHCSRSVHKAFTYDEVRVCVMCSQFFQLGQQDVYRPSYEKKVAEKNRKLRKEQQAAARAYWDPVKQLEQSNAKLKAQGAEHTLSSSG